MAGSVKKVYFPTTRLAELASRGGGITPSMAIEGALKSIESMRGESDGVLLKSVTAIEAIVDAPAARKALTDADLCAILRHADQIVTLAGTFGYVPLDAATRSLCDLADGLLRAGQTNPAPVRVHVQAIRLMAPGGIPLDAAGTQRILDDLAKVLDHFKFTSLGANSDSDELEAAIAAKDDRTRASAES